LQFARSASDALLLASAASAALAQLSAIPVANRSALGSVEAAKDGVAANNIPAPIEIRRPDLRDIRTSKKFLTGTAYHTAGLIKRKCLIAKQHA
jgi:hypothetical protein